MKNSKRLKEKLIAAKLAALPAMGKLFVGTVGKGLSKVAGDAIGEQLGDVFDEARELSEEASNEARLATSASVEAAFDTVSREVENLLDRRGAAMLADYRQRKRSRRAFRENMKALIAGIDGQSGGKRGPLVVVIDELDRCRPDFAIRVLEEIKHFFEVPGCVFILALHKDQLEKSMEVVYGKRFNIKSYLHRFFSRRYELRKLSVKELVYQQFQAEAFRDGLFNSPRVSDRSGNYVEVSHDEFVARLLDELRVTPRETTPIIDGLNFFALSWSEKWPIELAYLIPMLVNQQRGDPLGSPPEIRRVLKLPVRSHHSGLAAVTIDKVFTAFGALAERNLTDVVNDASDGEFGYVIERMREEFINVHGGLHVGGHPHPVSLLRRYADLVRLMGRSVDLTSN